MLIPVPGTGGAVIVGESVITFVSAAAVRSTAIKPTIVKVRRGWCCRGCVWLRVWAELACLCVWRA